MRKCDMERSLEMARKTACLLSYCGEESKAVNRETGGEVALRPYAMGGAVALGLLCLYASGESDLPDDPLEYVTRVLRISVALDRESAAGEVG